MNLPASLAIPVVLAAATFGELHAQSVRIATFNVNYDNADTDRIVETIQLAKADLVCLQEMTERTDAVLRDRLSDTYPHRETVSQFSFLSKFALGETQYHASHRCCSAVLKVGDRRIRIANIHLTPVFIPENPNVLRVLQAVSDKDDRNRAELTEILRHIDADLPTVLLGDFNSISTSKAPCLLQESGFIDSYAAVHEDADSDSTWDWRTMRKLEPGFTKNELTFADFARNLRFGLRVDYLFHSSHFRTLSSEIIGGGGSDHALVVSELKIDAQAQAPAVGPELREGSSPPKP